MVRGKQQGSVLSISGRFFDFLVLANSVPVGTDSVRLFLILTSCGHCIIHHAVADARVAKERGL